jgi:hypothetical protein
MKTYGTVGVYKHVFSTSVLVGQRRLDSRRGTFTLGTNPRYPVDRRLNVPDLPRKYIIYNWNINYISK